jgi:hypothetical protein
LQEFNPRLEYRTWKSKGMFSLAGFPFVLEPASKSNLLQLEAAIQMQDQIDASLDEAIETQTAPVPYLVLRVNREQVVTDTLKLLQILNSSDFKKPVKVKVPPCLPACSAP